MGLPVVLGATFAAASVADSVQRFRTARDRAQFQEQQFLAVRGAALDAFQQEATQVRTRTSQERQEIATEIENITQEALLRRGQASAAAASAGVSGRSVADAQLDITRAESALGGRLDTLQDFREAAALLRLRALRTQTRSRILGALPPPISQPNLLNEALGAVTSGLSGFGAGQDLEKAFE